MIILIINGLVIHIHGLGIHIHSWLFIFVGWLLIFIVFDSRIIPSMICKSMLSTKIQKLFQCTVALVNQTALQAYASFLNRLEHTTCWHGRGLLFQFLLFSMMYNKLLVFVSNFFVQS